MLAGNMNKLFNIWEVSLVPFDAPPPFTNANDMYETINSTPYDDLQWQSFTIHYNLHNDPFSADAPTAWKTAEYDGWFCDPGKLIHNMLANRAETRNLTTYLIKSTITMASTGSMMSSLVIGVDAKQ